MKQAAAYLALRAAVGLLGVLPEPVIRRAGEFSGLVWHACDPRRRRMAVRHMTRAGSQQPKRDARRVFQAYGRYWAESFWVRPRRFPGIRSTLTVEGAEYLEKARDAGRGVVVALPHLGNWEIAALVAVDLDLPLVAVAERLQNRRITEWFIRQRAMFDIEVVLTGSGPSSRRRLIGALDSGHAVALLCDRDLSGRGVKVRFFGELTTLPAGPASFALRTGAPLIPVGVYFGPGSAHRVVIHPPLDTGGAGADVEGLTQLLADRFEEIIGLDPSQWHLVQPNWPSDRE